MSAWSWHRTAPSEANRRRLMWPQAQGRRRKLESFSSIALRQSFEGPRTFAWATLTNNDSFYSARKEMPPANRCEHRLMLPSISKGQSIARHLRMSGASSPRWLRPAFPIVRVFDLKRLLRQLKRMECVDHNG